MITDETAEAPGDSLYKLEDVEWGDEGDEAKLKDELEKFIALAQQLVDRAADNFGELIEKVLTYRLKLAVGAIEKEGEWQIWDLPITWDSKVGEGFFAGDGFPIKIELTPNQFLEAFKTALERDKRENVDPEELEQTRQDMRNWIAQWRDAILQAEALIPPPPPSEAQP